VAKKKENAPDGFSLTRIWKEEKPVLVFVGLFTLLIVLFYLAWVSTFFTHHLFEPVIRSYAWISGKVLTLFGYQVQVEGTNLFSTGFAVNIKRGCDAIEASALFAAAVIAFPASTRKKIPGLLIGIAILALVNLTRIITLFMAGLKNMTLFNLLHDQVWQVIYIIIAVILLIFWLQYARPAKPAKNAS
jgi:exosortase H (IPTLxxWG-CTERM-specific)